MTEIRKLDINVSNKDMYIQIMHFGIFLKHEPASISISIFYVMVAEYEQT